MSTDLVRAKEIFLQALKCANNAERDAFLGEACGTDVDLRKHVDILIDADEQAGSFLQGGALATQPTLDQPITEKPGTEIGPYKLLQQIGEGGMGVVYMAEQKEPVKRRVALKIIKPGMDTRQVIARFEAERRALAMMDHPNIAKVLDAGTTETGRPYFVMELVCGTPITQYCDEQHLPPRERLQLFVPVCQAVQHAHQKGIIHRDIKPSNVMVAEYDERPVPKVIDFGVAKAIEHSLTEKTIFTEFGQVVGTPEYMSPEQARLSQLDIDTRSDIYSLGVLLYELLAGETPFDRQRLRSVAFDELLRIIREEEPPRPSIRLSTSDVLPSIAANRHIEPGKLAMLVRGELDWIVMKALEKDRTRRYETANGFAADIHRYLDGKAVEAGPPSGWYRFRKVVRQHRAVLLTTISAVVVLVAVVVGLAFHSYRIGQAYHEISQANDIATQAERDQNVQLAKSMLSEARWRRQSGQEGHRIEASRLISEAAAIILPRKPRTELILQLRNEWIATSALAVDLDRVRTFDRTLLGFDPRHRVYAWRDHEGRAIVYRTDDDHERARLVLSSDETALPWAAEFSDDLRFAMIVYDDSAMRLWDLERELPVLKVNVPSDGFAADFSPGNCLLAYGDRSGAIRLLDLSTSPPRKLPSTFTASGLSGMPRRLRFDPSGERIAVSCGHGGTLRSARDDAPSISDIDAANSAEHSPILADGSFDASRGQFRRTHGGIDVLELSSAERLLSIPHVPCSPGNVYWSPDGRFLAFGGSDFHIRIWNVEQNCLHALLEGHRWGGISASFSHEGDFVTSRSWDGTSRFWDFYSGQELLRTRAGAAHIRRPGDTRVFTATPDGGTLWDIAASSTLRIVPSSIARQTEEYGVWVHPGDRLSAAACGDGVHLFDLAARTEIAVLPLNGCRAALFSPRDGSLLTASSEGLHRWALQINAVSSRVQLSTPTTLTTHIGTWNSCASVTPDGMYLATIADNRVEVHDLDQGTVRLLDGSHEKVRSISISPDGQWVATGNWHGAGVKLWNVTEGRLADEDLWPRVRDAGVKFSPDGSRFAASSRSHYRVWQVGTWELLHEGPRDDGGMGRKLAFSPDGKVLAISVSSQVVRLLDSATGNELATLNSPYAFYVDHLAFNTEGNVLIALDRSLHVWNLGAIRKGLDQIGLDWNLPPCPASLATKEVQPLMIDASEIRRGLTSVRTGMEDREAYRKLVTVHERIRDEEATAGEVSAETHWRLAVSQLAAQDIDGYRTTCKAMLRHFGINSEDSWAKEMTAWVVALYENPEKDVSQAIAVALQLVEQRRNATNLRVLAACLFRAGRVEEAHQMLREALPGSKRPAYVFCLLALTSQELGRVDEAKTWLEKVDLSIHANEEVYWATRATIHLLRNQALAAIGG